MTDPHDDAPAPRRRYGGTRRAAAVAERRAAIVATAITMLRDADHASAVSLEDVARSAGVTRLTVYNQFGSRRGLLEAVAETLARSGGIAKLADVGLEPDAEAGLAMMVTLFCRFWTSDAAIGRIHDAIKADPDIAAALAGRLASGRDLIGSLVRQLRPEWQVAEQDDAADLIEVLTDYPSVVSLARGRDEEMLAKLVLQTCRAVLLLPGRRCSDEQAGRTSRSSRSSRVGERAPEP